MRHMNVYEKGVKTLNNVIVASNIGKKYKIHNKREGFKDSLIDLFHREYTYKEAVKDVSFAIEKGSIVGLLGKNGAGKTTTLKMLSGILHPSSGNVEVLGYNPTKREKAFLKRISFVMGNKSEINWDLPSIDTFRYQQLIYEVNEEEYQHNLKSLSQMLGVEHLLGIQLRRLSLGERMKMELINNFLYTPEVIFLDEPTIGLDLDSQCSIRTFIKQYAKEKKATIIITSHYMDDIEETCERVILLNKGRISFDDRIEVLKKNNPEFKVAVQNLMKEGTD